jgi:thiamine pyrophosphate-dependent acetolactate synthase large subunit-like protein
VERLFGIPVRRPRTAVEFEGAYREACASGAPTLIEVRTDRAGNLAAHRALGAAVVAAVEAP